MMPMLTDTCIKDPHVLWRTRQMVNAAVGNHDIVLYDGATRGGVGLVKLVAKVHVPMSTCLPVLLFDRLGDDFYALA